MFVLCGGCCLNLKFDTNLIQYHVIASAFSLMTISFAQYFAELKLFYLTYIYSFIFPYWLPHSIWSSQVRDLIQAIVVTYATVGQNQIFSPTMWVWIQPMPRCYKHATHSIAPQKEVQICMLMKRKSTVSKLGWNESGQNELDQIK